MADSVPITGLSDESLGKYLTNAQRQQLAQMLELADPGDGASGAQNRFGLVWHHDLTESDPGGALHRVAIQVRDRFNYAPGSSGSTAHAFRGMAVVTQANRPNAAANSTPYYLWTLEGANGALIDTTKVDGRVTAPGFPSVTFRTSTAGLITLDLEAIDEDGTTAAQASTDVRGFVIMACEHPAVALGRWFRATAFTA